MKNIYTDDKNRLETIKWLTIFIKKIRYVYIDVMYIICYYIHNVLHNELYFIS